MNRLFYISPLILQTAIWPATRVILRFFLHLKIIGLENLNSLKNKNRGIIFACNHTSELDVIMIPASLPFLSPFMPLFYVSRPTAFYKKSGWRKIFYGGLIFKLWGAYPAHSGFKDYEKSLAEHIPILNAGKSLIIFPEGKRSSDGTIGEARGGVAFLSKTLNLPVVPVRIGGIRQTFLSDFFLQKRRAVVNFGRPIYPADLHQESYKSSAQMIINHINNLSGTAGNL